MHRSRRSLEIQPIAVVPAMLTLANLVSGFFAIVVAARVDSRGEVEAIESWNLAFSGGLIFLAMLFDGFDGSVARWSRTASNFGTQLDSLADVVSFGVAPAFLLVKMCPTFTQEHREIVWVIAAAFAACTALRLARFNSQLQADDDHMHFRGLPSPAAAAAVASFAIMFYALRKPDNPLPGAAIIESTLQMVLPWYGALLALLMVTRIPYPHLINQLFRGRRGFNHIVFLLFAALALVSIRSYSLPLVAAVFALGPAVRYAWDELVLRKPHEEPLF